MKTKGPLDLKSYTENELGIDVINTMKWLLMDDALKCPHCGGVGFTVKPNYNTGEPEQEQCRWCHEFDWFRNRMKNG